MSDAESILFFQAYLLAYPPTFHICYYIFSTFPPPPPPVACPGPNWTVCGPLARQQAAAAARCCNSAPTHHRCLDTDANCVIALGAIVAAQTTVAIVRSTVSQLSR